jgi:hypothetical protein
MNSKRSFAGDSESGHRSKRRLIESLQQLSLNAGSSNTNNGAAESLAIETETDNDEYMDVYKPNTEFIPDIDRFLKEDEERDQERRGGLVVNKPFFKIPTSVMFRTDHLHFFQRPSRQLILYIPSWQLLYDNLLRWANGKGLLHEREMELDSSTSGSVAVNPVSGVYLLYGEMNDSVVEDRDFVLANNGLAATDQSSDSMDID